MVRRIMQNFEEHFFQKWINFSDLIDSLAVAWKLGVKLNLITYNEEEFNISFM